LIRIISQCNTSKVALPTKGMIEEQSNPISFKERSGVCVEQIEEVSTMWGVEFLMRPYHRAKRISRTAKEKWSRSFTGYYPCYSETLVRTPSFVIEMLTLNNSNAVNIRFKNSPILLSLKYKIPKYKCGTRYEYVLLLISGITLSISQFNDLFFRDLDLDHNENLNPKYQCCTRYKYVVRLNPGITYLRPGCDG